MKITLLWLLCNLCLLCIKGVVKQCPPLYLCPEVNTTQNRIAGAVIQLSNKAPQTMNSDLKFLAHMQTWWERLMVLSSLTGHSSFAPYMRTIFGLQLPLGSFAKQGYHTFMLQTFLCQQLLHTPESTGYAISEWKSYCFLILLGLHYSCLLQCHTLPVHWTIKATTQQPYCPRPEAGDQYI